MTPAKSSRPFVALLIGVVAVYAWVESLSYWAVHVFPPMLTWIWATFGVKGEWIVFASNIIHAALVGSAFAVILRLVSERRWLNAWAAFSAGFLVTFFVPPMFSDSQLIAAAISLLGASIAALLLTVALVSATLARYPKVR